MHVFWLFSFRCVARPGLAMDLNCQATSATDVSSERRRFDAVQRLQTWSPPRDPFLGVSVVKVSDLVSISKAAGLGLDSPAYCFGTLNASPI